MDDFYPAGPRSVRADLTKPTSAYKRHAYLAVAGVLLFLALYAALTGWFSWTAWRLLSSISRAPDSWLPLGLGGVASAFLAVLMIKAVIFIRRGQHEGEMEVTAAEYPRLFAFLHRLADEAKAPRPHRVFLSPRVNAGVYYDLSILNLVFPSKKNLEIGLGLINVLTLGEVKAVIAHEFGHFAQRTMAVGRWIYIAQQIAAHVVAKRDALDRMLQWISNFDIRVAWIGWILRLIVWSIRSVVETVFGWVVLAQRALSREMELQADLVAVSLTGSDALVHALHRLEAADDALDRALSFAESQRHDGKQLADLFAIQSEMLLKTRAILNDPTHGQVPPLPASPETHRVFKAQLAQPPRMWSTHPASDVREENAKREYVSCALDDRSAWILFEDETRVRSAVTAQMYEAYVKAKAKEGAEVKPLEVEGIEDSLQTLSKSFDRAFLDAKYRGVYLGRSVVRSTDKVAELYGDMPADPATAIGECYPPTLAADLERVRELSEEKALLRGIEHGLLQAPAGIVRYRGQDHHRRDLPKLVAKVDDELVAARRTLSEHDRRVRTAHLAAARQLSPAWAEYLEGLAAILHYADHREADLEDALGSLENVVGIVLADRKVTESEIERLVMEARDIYQVLTDVHAEAANVDIGGLAEKLEAESFKEMLGEEFDLPPAAPEHMGDWLNVIHSWVGAAVGACARLGSVTLDELLRVEEMVATSLRSGTPLPDEVPAPPGVPPRYETLVVGKERPRQMKLGWWDRFQIADGFVPATARLLCAGAIVGGVVLAGRSVGNATVHVINGLDRVVVVEIGRHPFTIPARSSVDQEIDNGTVTISARTLDGKALESFDADADAAFGHYVYNVMRAAPLIEFDPKLDKNRPLGAPRWIETEATRVFDTPQSVYVRDKDPPCIVSMAALHPMFVAGNAGKDADAVIAVHARWEPTTSANFETWLSLAAKQADYNATLDARLAEAPDDVMARRMEQERGPRDEVCQRHGVRAVEKPDSPAWQYLAMRCIGDVTERNRQVEALFAKWPNDPWIVYAEAGAVLDRGELDTATALLDRVQDALPSLASSVNVLRARVMRAGKLQIPNDYAEREPMLEIAQQIERGGGAMTSSFGAFVELYKGNLAEATAIDKAPTVTMLVACSDGATQEMIDAASALTPDTLEAKVALLAYALALRTGRDPAPYKTLVGDDHEMAQGIAFLDAVHAAKKDVEAVPPPVDFLARMHAYSAATTLLGEKTPAAWRNDAKTLFAFERPYFK